MKVFLALLLLFSTLFSCGGGVNPPQPSHLPEVPAVDSDSLASDTMMGNMEPTAHMEGIFDDFVYDFMNYPKFQRERIVFPLKITGKSGRKTVNKGGWRHQRLYLDTLTYVHLFSSLESMQAENDTSLRAASIEWFHLLNRSVDTYRFSKTSGLWRLDSICYTTFDHHPNGDFMEFYRLFVTNEQYSLEHVSQPFLFKTYDPETSQEIEGWLDAYQWTDYAPHFPDDVVVNVDYAQQYEKSLERILVVTTPSEGTYALLHFRYTPHSGWLLVMLEN